MPLPELLQPARGSGSFLPGTLAPLGTGSYLLAQGGRLPLTPGLGLTDTTVLQKTLVLCPRIVSVSFWKYCISHPGVHLDHHHMEPQKWPGDAQHVREDSCSFPPRRSSPCLRSKEGPGTPGSSCRASRRRRPGGLSPSSCSSVCQVGGRGQGEGAW